MSIDLGSANSLQQLNYPQILSGNKRSWVFLKIWFFISLFTLRKYKSPIKYFKVVQRIIDLRKRYTVNNKYDKISLVDGRYYFNSNSNGWPSKHFHRLFEIEARDVIYNDVKHLENLRMVLIAFTKKCPLNCEHCYEGPELNKKDSLTLDDHKKIISKLQGAGVSVFQFGGGEPLAKVNDLVELLEFAENSADFWIFTSGFNLTEANARRLKQAGLTGVGISLDHHIEEKHNRFRRNDKAYQWAIDAAKNARNAKLVITLSLCITREFVSEKNLLNYLKLAKKLGASFVQFSEPRSVGNYAGQEVHLNMDQIKIAEDFFIYANQNLKDLPIIQYPDYHQRKTGCPGAGSKYLYIDTDGYMSSCPFCRNKKTHILDGDHENSIESMKADGCDLVENLN